MRPFQVSYAWNIRPQDVKEQINTYKFVYFLCEGKNTEFNYFNGLKINKKVLKINNNIELCIFEKTDNDIGLTDPKKMFDKSVLKIEELKEDGQFCDDDLFVIIFDTDTFSDQNALNEYFSKYNHKNIKFGVTYPSFEIFLYSHDENKLKGLILNHSKEVIDNIKIKNQRPIIKHFVNDFKFNPKKAINKEKIEKFAMNVDEAIKNSRYLEYRTNLIHKNLSSNISDLLNEILFKN